MLNAINSTIQGITGYSFSLSNIPKNISKVALTAIALATGIYASTVSAKYIGGSYDCQLSCLKGSLPPVIGAATARFYCVANTCKQTCEAYSP